MSQTWQAAIGTKQQIQFRGSVQCRWKNDLWGFCTEGDDGKQQDFEGALFDLPSPGEC